MSTTAFFSIAFFSAQLSLHPPLLGHLEKRVQNPDDCLLV